MTSVFLSHSSVDKQFAHRLARDLEDHGIRVWIDQAEMLVGDSLLAKIEAGIQETNYLAVILSPDSVQSEWVRKEVEIAMGQEIHGRRVRVLPILYKDCDMPGFLATKRWADLRALNYSWPRTMKRSADASWPAGIANARRRPRIETGKTPRS